MAKPEKQVSKVSAIDLPKNTKVKKARAKKEKAQEKVWTKEGYLVDP